MIYGVRTPCMTTDRLVMAVFRDMLCLVTAWHCS